MANKQVGGSNQSIPFAETSAQNFAEGVLGMGVRVWLQPWINVGLIEGISYNTSSSNYEQTSRDKESQLLNYLGFEIEALVSKRFSLVGRVHHRSGAFGTFGGVKGGSNAYLVGFRYRFGDRVQKEVLTTLPPPAGCPGKVQKNKEEPKSLDDSLDLNSLSKLQPFLDFDFLNKSAIKTQFQGGSEFSKTNFSKLSFAEQENLRANAIALIDQRVDNIELKSGFSVQAKVGIQNLSPLTEEKNQPGSIKLSQVTPKAGSKLVTGSITRWRVQATKIKLNPAGWKADRMSFSNDPFTPTQTRIDARNVEAREEDNGDILITTRRSRLILEERMSIPIVNSTRIKRSETVQNRWIVGIDRGDRDGVFVGRSFKPIKLSSQYNLLLQPQFLIQRSIKDETNSYIADGASVTSDNVRQSISSADLFGLKAKLKGETFGFDTRIDGNISTFNSKRIANGSRYWGSLNRSFDVPLLDNVNTTLFGAYRYRVWNGSIGETDIHTAYAGTIDKSIVWDWGNFNNIYFVRLGLGNYQAEVANGGSLNELWRANFYSSLNSSYTIWQANKVKLASESTYRYSPKPITPGLKLDTYLSTALFSYEDGSTQNVFSFSSGPSITFGTFTKPFLDYTKFSIYYGGAIKQGESPFSFDDVVDLATLGVGLTQQIAGPLVLNTGFEFNIDEGSDYFGKTINSNIELRWHRRSYDLGIYYKPSSGIGGISVHLNDFNFTGTGLPFIPSSSDRYGADIVKSDL